MNKLREKITNEFGIHFKEVPEELEWLLLDVEGYVGRSLFTGLYAGAALTIIVFILVQLIH